MNNSKIVFIVNQAARLIKASYDGPTSDVKVAGTPFKTLDPSIKVDDLVIVETSTRHGFTVVKVTEVDLDVDFDSTEELRWAFNPLDLAGFQELKAAESARLTFSNGYGVSVRFEGAHISPPQYEVAVLYADRLCYSTKITSDVVRFASVTEVTELRRRIQSLHPKV